mmetsp:Transcript_33070/g.80364  ORF Transcript_33070/g.80364 Transcript_33070/m.80364 type:complete len:129 (-) Transcript_33070:36-422(-)
MPSGARKYLNKRKSGTPSSSALMVLWLLVVFIGAAYTSPELFWPSSSSSTAVSSVRSKGVSPQVPADVGEAIDTSSKLVRPSDSVAGNGGPETDSTNDAIPSDASQHDGSVQPRAFDRPPNSEGDMVQ